VVEGTTRDRRASTRCAATTSASTARLQRQAHAPAARPARVLLDHRRAPGRLPGAAAVELGHNFSLVHDDIEDDDRERRHRPTLWALHGIPQAINTGDMLFSLSRVALHRLTDLGFPDRTVLR
jgi:geranylgeranyl pyrophosphate synthase